ncbi:lysozyme inhibitor LprI family protein [Cognatiyoonia sp. IB215446]|uniref:lysozyme inhibitor LprI family protein n=1 Tax=Cognatiyoonia sp. IB215446 TaxID=3097355 RepID=UPI002A13D492|nr:lysozyme inhibitor LprI family protein [Cognatiyoonia sp. IB215446]MDX8349517.1 lysozyme inhibitor LprI family protein [Cognatiyoonia sp. IB215446]
MRWLAILLLTAPQALAADEPWPFSDVVAACYSQGNASAECIGDAATACMDSDPAQTQTTLGMMFCFLGERDAWDVLLNQEYQKARNFAQSMDEQDREFFPEYAVRDDQVLAAQRAWIAFRDTNCAMAYGLWGAGSMRQIAGAECMMRMTAEQTLALRVYQEHLR